MRPIALFRFLAFLGLAVSFVTTGSLILVFGRTVSSRRRWLATNISIHSRITLKMMGVEVIVKPVTQNQSNVPGRLMAANHMGYLDVLALASTYPCLFVTSVEVKEMPFLGLLTQMGGCLYVERRSKMVCRKRCGKSLKHFGRVILFCFFQRPRLPMLTKCCALDAHYFRPQLIHLVQFNP
jgi:1-acyl-sn-glycerol-3-phosphate acyltransferase